MRRGFSTAAVSLIDSTCALTSALIYQQQCAFSASSGRLAGFRPFSVEDEAQLVSVLTTKPRHVARHIRQSMQSSRKQQLQFRNSVTFLMIQLQAQLQKRALHAADASAIVESVMKECVELRQADMAHLLFRAALRFRKYGLKLTYKCVKYLFESYRTGDARALMSALADELRGDGEMRTITLMALLYANRASDAEALLQATSYLELTTEDLLAVVDGYGSLKNFQRLDKFFDEHLTHVSDGKLPQVNWPLVCSAIICCCRGDYPTMGTVYRKALATSAKSLPLTDAAVGYVFRARASEIETMAEVYELENVIKAELGGLPTLGLPSQTAMIAKCSELISRGQAAGDEIMLVKVQHLKAVIDANIQQATGSGSSGTSASTAVDLDDVLDQQYIFSMIKGFGILGKLDDMRTAFEQLKKYGAIKDHRVYDELLRWYAYANNVKEVIAVKEEMSAQNVYHSSQTFHHVFRVLDRHYPRMIEKYAQEMRSREIPMDAPLYVVLIRVFSELGDTKMVDELYNDVKQRARNGQVHLMTPHVTTQLLRAFSRQPTVCEAIIDDAKAYGHLTSAIVQAEIINFFSSQNRMEEMVALVHNLPTKSRPVFRVLLRNATRKNDKKRFEEVLSELRSSGVPMNDVLFGVAISGYSHFGDIDGVKKMVDEARQSDAIRQAHFFAVAATAFAKVNDFAAVDQCWDQLVASKLSISMTVFNKFLEVYMGSGNLDRVQVVLDCMMASVPPNPITATTVVDMLGKMGRLSEMESLLEDMSHSANAAPTQVTYHQALNAYAKAGDIHKMEVIRETMRAKHISENHVTYNILIDGYGRAKRLEHIKDLVAERKAKQVPMEEYGYVILLNIYSRCRMLPEIHEIVREIDGDSSIKRSAKLLSAMANAFAVVGDAASAERYVQLVLQHPGKTAHHVESIFTLYSKLRDTRRLQQLLDDPLIEKTEFMYNVCITAFARSGEHTKVALLLQQLETLKMSLNRNTAVTLSSLLLKAGKLQLAQAVLQMNTTDGRRTSQGYRKPLSADVSEASPMPHPPSSADAYPSELDTVDEVHEDTSVPSIAAGDTRDDAESEKL